MDVVIIMAVMFVAAVVQGASGFGFGLIAVALMGLFSPIDQAAVMNVLPALAVNAFLIYRLHANIQWRQARLFALVAVLATPFGVLLLHDMPLAYLQLILAAVLLATIARSIIPPTKTTRRFTVLFSGVMGILAGILAGAFGTGGPPTLGYVNSLHLHRLQQVATIQLILGILGLIRVLEFLRNGMLSDTQWAVSGAAAIAAIPGVGLGLFLLYRMPEPVFRLLVLGMLSFITFRFAWNGIGQLV